MLGLPVNVDAIASRIGVDRGSSVGDPVRNVIGSRISIVVDVMTIFSRGSGFEGPVRTWVPIDVGPGAGADRHAATTQTNNHNRITVV